VGLIGNNDTAAGMIGFCPLPYVLTPFLLNFAALKGAPATSWHSYDRVLIGMA